MPDEIVARPDGTIEAQIGKPTRVVIPPGGPRRPEQDPHDDGYPDIIVDQRRGYQNLEADTTDEVFAYWERWLSRQRPPVRPWVSGHSVVPYINHSRWVADCDCGGGMLCWDQNPYTCCLSCGGFYTVDWQLPSLRSEVIRLLAIREPSKRNWDSRKVDKQGDPVETVDFLQRENMLTLGKPR
jgi:hypothetical protein